jgi:hypothetical protein
LEAGEAFHAEKALSLEIARVGGMPDIRYRPLANFATAPQLPRVLALMRVSAFRDDNADLLK